DAAEVTQDAFVKIYYALEKFRGDSSFTTWLYRIVTNLAHNRVRHLLSRGKDCNVPLVEEIRHDGRDCATVDEVIAREEHQRFLDALEKLSADHRAVIVLYSVQDLSYEEIAAALEISIGTVKSRLSRARVEL